jgi:hypothetical protein
VSELFCEEIAHKAGFIVSVGNWISPDGILITGEDYESHHWETIKKFLGYEPETDNHLSWMNEQVGLGYIRLVFRNDVLFQVGCSCKEEIWSDAPNMTMMRTVLERVPNIEIHIFSRTFYVIGKSQDILNKNLDALQIQEKS